MVRRRLCGLAGSMALHVALVGLLFIIAPQGRWPVELGEEMTGTTAVVIVGPEALSAAPGDQVLGEEDSATESPSQSENGDLHVSGLDIDIDRLFARRNWLFPYLTTGLLFLERAEEQVGVPNVKLTNPFAAGRLSSGRAPISMSDAELQRIVDRAWSRRERWSRFSEIAKLVETHDPDRGRLPELLQRYLDQNLLQPYYDSTERDPRFWAMLDCVADHVQFIDWVRSFARKHPSSRTTTELLFLLDEFAQGSRDTLLMLLSTDPNRDLQHTFKTNPRAYGFAVWLRSHYAGWLRDRQREAPAQIRRHYDELRLQLLSTIIESSPGGYRVADARFLAGEILFNQNNMPAALRMWHQIRPDARDSYVKTYSELLDEIESPGGGRAVEINRILGVEYRRWLDFSEGRLRQFGYAFDTF
jgi:hypothetical protein